MSKSLGPKAGSRQQAAGAGRYIALSLCCIYLMEVYSTDLWLLLSWRASDVPSPAPQGSQPLPSSPPQTEMESGDSSHSLSSRRQSELGSHYVMESGVYMSSFAATIFIASLVTIGVLLLTLLVALTVMLESCESRNSGVFELAKARDQSDYCDLFGYHAELNNLDINEFPTICKQHALSHINEGRFLQELNLTVQLAENFFSTLKPDEDGLDLILIDIDDLFLADITSHSKSSQPWMMQFEGMKHTAHMLIFRLHMKLKTAGWSLVLLSRKPGRHKNATVESLISAGYSGWASLIMRSDEELLMEDWEYVSARRVELEKQGLRIASVISSRMDAFRGPCLGKRNFKLAHPMYTQLLYKEAVSVYTV